MNKRGSAAIIMLVIALAVSVAAAYWYVESQKSAVVTSTTSSITTNGTGSSSQATGASSNNIICATSTNEFSLPPLPANNFNWTQVTLANTTKVYGPVHILCMERPNPTGCRVCNGPTKVVTTEVAPLKGGGFGLRQTRHCDKCDFDSGYAGDIAASGKLSDLELCLLDFRQCYRRAILYHITTDMSI